MPVTGERYDAAIVGSGPNGLAAAVHLARLGFSVIVLEAKDTIGGGTRTAELTLPGFQHDVCSAIHPLLVASPFFKQLPLEEYGVKLVYSKRPVAHPLEDGSAAFIDRSVDVTADALGRDGKNYKRVIGPLVRNSDKLAVEILGPMRPPRHLIAMAPFGLRGLRSAVSLATSTFENKEARGLFGGLAAHSMLALEDPLTAGVAMLLAFLAHSVGWPSVEGGSQKIADGLAAYLHSLGGKIETGQPVKSMADIPPARVVLFDVGPHELARIAGSELSDRYVKRLTRFRYGPGVFKVDWALDEPIPWTAPECRNASTVHAVGSLPQVAASEALVKRGQHPERPFVLLGQQSQFDPTRAPDGKHTAWAYCHVPNGSSQDMTERIEAQVERFAPGFRDLIIGRAVMNSVEYERYNPNYVGGDINGGVQDLMQHFARPMLRINPYTTSNERIFLCSSSTPPGGGVHGMCGYHAARAAARVLA